MKKQSIYTTIILITFYFGLINLPTTWADKYHYHIYPLIDRLLVSFFSWSEFSIGDFLYAILILYCLYRLIKFIIEKKWIKLLQFTINTTFIILSIFQIFWGLNNFKSPLHEKLHLKTGYSPQELYRFTEKKIHKINQIHLQITQDSTQWIDFEKDYNLFYTETINNLPKVDFLKTYSISQLKKAKPSIYSYFQTKMGFSGYFNPFTHENQINSKIPNISTPTTYTHELIHQLGFSSEAETNFITYCTLSQSSNLHIRYSAELFAVKYALKEILLTDEEKYLEYNQQLKAGIIKNIENSYIFWQQNKNFTSPIAKKLYGLFLKTNNQKEGIRSYNKVVDLMINYESISSDSLRFRG